jgi:hypothetical protein
MSNYQAVFIGSCLVIASGVIGISLGLLARAMNQVYSDGAVIPGLAAVTLGCVFAFHALKGMSSKSKPD